MKISVVIPTYNEEKYIRRCLTSLMKQQEKPDEIIIVNNNCTDRTLSIIKKFKNITVIEEPQQGMIPARNTGFDAAKYEIIARTDADAVLPTDWILKIKNHFKDPNIDGVAGPISMRTRSKMPIIDTQVIEVYMKIMEKILGHSTYVGPNISFKKSLWKKIRTNVCTDDKKVHEDIDLAIHIAEEKGVIVYDPTLVVTTSARRVLKKPHSFFVEYPIRILNTIAVHKISL